MNNRKFETRQWIFISLINFCIVALAGITLRYKINFPLPFINQKYLLHAHSHFAFTGWVALALMTLMIHFLQQQRVMISYRKYNWILMLNCLIAYGMFFTFIWEGYALFSIIFSTLSLFISYFFIYNFWSDLNKIVDKSPAVIWFKAAMVLWAISSLGAFALAYLMANHINDQEYYFSAIYFFLHFQYNGWFLFACFGLLFSYLIGMGILPAAPISKNVFLLMAITVVPTYLLSLLWLKLPGPLHFIAELSGILQLAVLFYFVRLLPLLKKYTAAKFTKATRYLWFMAYLAFILKIILQMLSAIPYFSHYAFGFRPIVIGYLHLSFLGIISFFIIGYFNQMLSGIGRCLSFIGVVIFAAGVLLQEIILMLQGLEVMELNPLPYADIILFYSAIVMGAGLVWITINAILKGTPKIK